MDEKFMDAAVSLLPDRAIFFVADQYVVWDYSAGSDRVQDGVHSLDTFPPGSATGFPQGLFQPAGLPPAEDSARLITAALAGKGPYADALYFFSGARYVRFDQSSGTFTTAGGAQDTSAAWHIPAPVNDPDGCFNGAKNRSAYCYFFKGPQYWRYVWRSDAIDSGYPKPISTLVGMPAPMHAGIDAATDGVASAGSEVFDAGYLFKNDRYVRFNWVNNGEGEPAAGAIANTVEQWPGLLELLAAARAKAQAIPLLRRAIALTDSTVRGGAGPADVARVNSALTTHFRASDNTTATQVLNGLRTILSTLQQSAKVFRYRDRDQGVRESLDAPSGNPNAAYTTIRGVDPATPLGTMNFTTQFLSRTENNRLLTVMHEVVHVFDPEGGLPENHISEWYVSPGLRAGFGLRDDLIQVNPTPPTFYDTQPTANALHNPAAFATYTRHLATGVDIRSL